jgi:hypothetical protein
MANLPYVWLKNVLKEKMMALTLTTTQTTELKLSPRLKSKLLQKLKTYAELRTRFKALEAEMEAQKGEIGLLREEAGVQSLALEGFKVAEITGLRKTLNPMKLIAMGVSVDMLEEATEVKPNKPYTKITVPGEKSDRD